VPGKDHRFRQVAIALVLVVAMVVAWMGWRSPANRVVAADVAARPLAAVPATARGTQVTPADEATLNPCTRAWHEALRTRARKLRATDDAMSLLAYALTAPLDTPLDARRRTEAAMARDWESWQRETQRASQRAAELAPDDAGVTWLAANLCVGGDACRALWSRAETLAPDNMAVWIAATGKAGGDPEALDRAIERAAAAPRYDMHEDLMVEAVTNAYASMPRPAACANAEARAADSRQYGSTQELTGLDHALVIANGTRSLPAYRMLLQRCKPGSGGFEEGTTTAACAIVFRRLAEGDTLHERLLALPALIELTRDEADGRAVRERYRETLWIQDQLGSAMSAQSIRIEDNALGEAMAMEARMREAGRWPPPDDWLPSDRQARSLILTGRRAPEPTR